MTYLIMKYLYYFFPPPTKNILLNTSSVIWFSIGFLPFLKLYFIPLGLIKRDIIDTFFVVIGLVIPYIISKWRSNIVAYPSPILLKDAYVTLFNSVQHSLSGSLHTLT